MIEEKEEKKINSGRVKSSWVLFESSRRNCRTRLRLADWLLFTLWQKVIYSRKTSARKWRWFLDRTKGDGDDPSNYPIHHEFLFSQRGTDLCASPLYKLLNNCIDRSTCPSRLFITVQSSLGILNRRVDSVIRLSELSPSDDLSSAASCLPVVIIPRHTSTPILILFFFLNYSHRIWINSIRGLNFR